MNDEDRFERLMRAAEKKKEAELERAKQFERVAESNSRLSDALEESNVKARSLEEALGAANEILQRLKDEAESEAAVLQRIVAQLTGVTEAVNQIGLRLNEYRPKEEVGREMERLREMVAALGALKPEAGSAEVKVTGVRAGRDVDVDAGRDVNVNEGSEEKVGGEGS